MYNVESSMRLSIPCKIFYVIIKYFLEWTSNIFSFLGIINRAKELQLFSLDDRLSIPPEFPFVSNIRYSMDKRYYIS